MSDASPTSDDFERDGPEDASNGLARRSVLQATVGAVGAGGLLLGAGSATANGKGGQGIVREDLFLSDETFEILEVPETECDDISPDGSCLDPEKRLPFRCNGKGGRFPPGKGGALPFPWWHFRYLTGVKAGERFRLYTRDNSIETGITYRWSRKRKDCPETPDYFQVGFVAGGTR